MYSKPSTTLVVITGCLLSVAAGCGRSSEPRVELTGTLLLDGVPVMDAQVHLSTTAAGRKKPGAYSVVVDYGEFEFRKTQALPPGQYEVFVTPVDGDAEEMIARILEEKNSVFVARDRLITALAKKGPIRVDLATNRVNEIKIELTTR